MFGKQVEWLVVGILRLLDRLLPKSRPLRVGLLVLAVWLIWTGSAYFISWEGSRTSPSGTVPNHAYHHLGDAIAKGTAFTLLCLVVGGGIGYWQWKRRWQ
jgi:hypothetical protein